MHLEDIPRGYTYPKDIPGGYTQSIYLEDTLRGYTRRIHPEDTPAGYTWRIYQEDTLGGYTWRSTFGAGRVEGRLDPTFHYLLLMLFTYLVFAV